MKIWINKNDNEEPEGSYENAYIFSLKREEYSTIYTNISDTWLRLGSMSISPIYEDLFVIVCVNLIVLQIIIEKSPRGN